MRKEKRNEKEPANMHKNDTVTKHGSENKATRHKRTSDKIANEYKLYKNIRI